MNVTMTVFSMVSFGLHVISIGVIVFLLWLGNQHRIAIWQLTEFKKGLIAHAKAAPVRPSKALIDEWLLTYDDLPKGSPRKRIYLDRLIEVGILKMDGLGNAVRARP